MSSATPADKEQTALPSPQEPSKQEMAEALQLLKAKIEEARKERAASAKLDQPPEVRLVAISKTKSVECCQNAYDLGVRVFGENYTHEVVAKAPYLPADVEWHFVGHLQSNKAKELINAAKNITTVETVDSTKLADKLNKAVEQSIRKDVPLRVYIQVNTSGEESKSGVEPNSELIVELATFIKTKCPSLVFSGLMTIGMLDYTSTPENFQCLYDLREKVAAELQLPPSSLDLSMGMSGDYYQAIVMGATNVRVGSTIFGKRAPKPATPPKSPKNME